MGNGNTVADVKIPSQMGLGHLKTPPPNLPPRDYERNLRREQKDAAERERLLDTIQKRQVHFPPPPTSPPGNFVRTDTNTVFRTPPGFNNPATFQGAGAGNTPGANPTGVPATAPPAPRQTLTSPPAVPNAVQPGLNTGIVRAYLTDGLTDSDYLGLPSPWNVLPRADMSLMDEVRCIEKCTKTLFKGVHQDYCNWRLDFIENVHKANVPVRIKLTKLKAWLDNSNPLLANMIVSSTYSFDTYAELIIKLEQAFGNTDRALISLLTHLADPIKGTSQLSKYEVAQSKLNRLVNHAKQYDILADLENPMTFATIVGTLLSIADRKDFFKLRDLRGPDSGTHSLNSFFQHKVNAARELDDQKNLSSFGTPLTAPTVTSHFCGADHHSGFTHPSPANSKTPAVSAHFCDNRNAGETLAGGGEKTTHSTCCAHYGEKSDLDSTEDEGDTNFGFAANKARTKKPFVPKGNRFPNQKPRYDSRKATYLTDGTVPSHGHALAMEEESTVCCNVDEEDIPHSDCEASDEVITFLTNEKNFKLPECPFCPKNRHFINSCEEFKKWDAVKRLRKILAAKRCANCFSNKHAARDCPKPSKCDQGCKSKHHSMLHTGPSQS
jgi:hypothetical protein